MLPYYWKRNLELSKENATKGFAIRCQYTRFSVNILNIVISIYSVQYKVWQINENVNIDQIYLLCRQQPH